MSDFHLALVRAGWLASALLVVAGFGCADAALRADKAFTAGSAQVERVEVRTTPAPLASAVAIVHGVLPDPCTEIDLVEQARIGSRFEVTITTRRAFGAVCAAVVTPFQHSVYLDASFLEPGLYSVDVNGVQETFSVSRGTNWP